MARGDGITRIRGAAANRPLPEGREPGDARGATWPVLLVVVGVATGLIAGAMILGSVLLYINDRPVGPWVREISPYVLGLLGAIFTVLLTKILNNDGRGLRNQQTLAANQDAVHRLVKGTADGLLSLAAKVERLDRRLDERSDDALAEELAAATRELRLLRDETSARIGRAVATITGPQRAIDDSPGAGRTQRPPATAPGPVLSKSSPLSTPPPPAQAEVDDDAPDPFDLSKPWHTGHTGVTPALPPATPPSWRRPPRSQ